MAPKPFDDHGLHSSSEQVLIVQSEKFSPAFTNHQSLSASLAASFAIHPPFSPFRRP
jgi:hypothetical protein